MTNSIRLYISYLALSLRAQMQYRTSVLLAAVAVFLLTFSEFAGVLVLFHRFGSLRGWLLPEIALLYGLVNLAWTVAEGVGTGWDLFARQVRSGEFDRLLLRPRSTALQVAGEELRLMRAGRLLQALLVLLWAASALDLAWTPARVLLLLLALVGGACLFYGLLVLQATTAFWTIESLEIWNTVTYGGVETGQDPLTIYRPWFRWFFTLVIPLACVTYFPVHTILGRPEPLGTPPIWGWLSPGVGVLFLLFSLKVWNWGERHYRSTGS